MTKASKNGGSDRASLLVLVGAALVMICVPLFAGINDGALVGDMIGGVGGAAALLLMYIAVRKQSEQVRMQSEELALQRKELQETRKEMKLQRKEMVEQAKISARQATATEAQNELLRLQIAGGQYPLTEILIRPSVARIEYTIVNHGPGIAIVRSMTITAAGTQDEYGAESRTARLAPNDNLLAAFLDPAPESPLSATIHDAVKPGLQIMPKTTHTWFVLDSAKGPPRHSLDDPPHTSRAIELVVGGASESRETVTHRYTMADIVEAWRMTAQVMLLRAVGKRTGDD